MVSKDAFVSHNEAGKHMCPADGCGLQISNRFAFCRRHWYEVPAVLRSAIWASYCKGNAGTVGHIELIDKAVRAMFVISEQKKAKLNES